MAETIEGFRLSVQQRRLWHLCRAGHRGCAQCVVSLTGALDTDRLVSAIGAVVRRHDMLRTRLRRASGLFYPLQVVTDGEEFTHRTLDGDRAALEQILDEERIAPDGGPPLRTVLLRAGAERAYLVVTLPAWGADARSLGNVVTQVGEAYAGEVSADAAQYVQFAEWQHETLEAGDQAALSFWRAVTGRAANAASPPFAASGGAQNTMGRATATRPIRLPEEVAAALAAAAKVHETSVELVVLSCWIALLLRHQQDTDTTVGAGLDGRPFPELASSVGPFSRRVPVPVSVSDDTRLRDVIAQVSQPFVGGRELLDHYRPVEPPALLPVGFEIIPWPADETYGGVALAVERLEVDAEAEQLVLRCRLDQVDHLVLGYDPECVAREAADALAEQLCVVVTTLTTDPDFPVRRLDLSTVESVRLLDGLNGTGVDHGSGGVLDSFAEWVARTPAQPAVVGGGTTLSYAELDRRSTALQQVLSANGVGPDARVALSHEHSVDLVVGVMGILKSGAAFVPLDPGWPSERLQRILADSGATVLVTQRSIQSPPGIAVVTTDDVPTSPADGPRRRPLPDNLAYVMYTSGSTGTPKGVAVTHRGLANYLAWCARSYRLDAGRGSLVHTSVGFDLTITGLLAPLVLGGTVHLAAPPGIEGLVRALGQGGDFSLVKLTPAHLDLLAQLRPEGDVAGLARDLVIGGEALTEEALSYWRAHAPDTHLVNEYGPTETVVGCIVHTALHPSRRAAVPIGRPIDNTRAYLLDEDLRRVGLGIVGELYVGGAGVARGYHGRPDLTAERFVPDPFSGEPGARLYRTGDLARYLPNGDLEYVGRADDQIQLHGFRVEPGDVEAVLVRHPEVRSAAVTARDGRLHGYVTTATREGFDRSALRAFVAERLPAYMVPASVTVLDAMPLTSNGKVDRAALPEPRGASRPASEFVGAPSGPEELVAAIWREALGVDQVGVHDNFFDLGAHSFLLVDVAARLQRQFGVEVSVLTLFEHPTVSALARAIGAVPAEGMDGPGAGDEPPERDERARQRREATRRLREQQLRAGREEAS